MRRLSAGLAGSILAASGVITIGLAAPAALATECGATGGTVPGTPAQTITLDVPGVATFYVDDRDFADADDDGVSQGIWTYMESNGVAGLQVGGQQFLLGQLPVSVPHVDPISVDGPDPVNHVITLFPSGLGGGNLAQTAGEADTCNDISGSYDTLVW